MVLQNVTVPWSRRLRGARLASRVFLRASRMVARVVGLFSARAYMRMVIPLFRALGVRMNGKPRFIAPSVYIDDLDKVTLGDRCVLSAHVVLLTHDYSYTTALRAVGRHEGGDVALIRPIMVGSNVFVGWGTIIMPGTTVEDDVVIGAGSVVRGRVAEGSVVMGSPAQVVCTIAQLAEKYAGKKGDYTIRQDQE